MTRPTFFREPKVSDVRPVEISLPGRNSLGEILRGVAHELKLRSGVDSIIHEQAVLLRVGELAVGCGLFDGTWGAMAIDPFGRRVSLWENAFMAFSDREMCACGHVELTNAFMASIRSLRSGSPENYLRFVWDCEFARSGGYRSHGRCRCYFRPALDIRAVDGLIAQVHSMLTAGELAALPGEDIKWLHGASAGVRNWRNLASIVPVMDYITGLNDIACSKQTPAVFEPARIKLIQILTGIVLPAPPLGEGRGPCLGAE